MSLFLSAQPPLPRVYPLWGPRPDSTPTRGRSLFKCKSRLRDVGVSRMGTGCFWSLHFLLTNWEWNCFPDDVRASDRNLEKVNESLKFCQYEEEVERPYHRPIKLQNQALRDTIYSSVPCAAGSLSTTHIPLEYTGNSEVTTSPATQKGLTGASCPGEIESVQRDWEWWAAKAFPRLADVGAMSVLRHFIATSGIIHLGKGQLLLLWIRKKTHLMPGIVVHI